MPERTATITPAVISPAQPDFSCLGIDERRANNFEVRFDTARYKAIYAQRANLEPQEFQRRLDQADGLAQNNLTTALMERFNVQLSQVRYEIVNGKLKSPHHDEPMEEVILRGQQYRLRNGNPVDQPREAAEVINFQKRQENINRGAKTNVYISPKGAEGTDYIHHFFGTDEVQEDGSVITSIYTLKIPNEKLIQAAKELDPNFPDPKPNEPLDAFILRNLITNVPIEKILSVLHQDEAAMQLSEFGAKVEIPTRELRHYYLQRAREGASDDELSDIRKSIFKLADISTGKDTFTPDNAKALAQIISLAKTKGVQAVVATLATQQLRYVPTNCGLPQEGKGAMSVGDFGIYRDSKGTLQIVCKTCGLSYMRTTGVLESGCRLCSGTDGIAC